MKLESLKLNKFKDIALKREQLFTLNGGGIATGGGNITGPHGASGQNANYNYGYDSSRNGVLTFHDRSNVVFQQVFPDEELPTLSPRPLDFLIP